MLKVALKSRSPHTDWFRSSSEWSHYRGTTEVALSSSGVNINTTNATIQTSHAWLSHFGAVLTPTVGWLYLQPTINWPAWTRIYSSFCAQCSETTYDAEVMSVFNSSCTSFTTFNAVLHFFLANVSWYFELLCQINSMVKFWPACTSLVFVVWFW